jgi:hypothetical protein
MCNRATRAALFFILLFINASCVVVPKLDGAANVSIRDVARRVKCDIATAVQKKLREFPTDRRHLRQNPFIFLTGWGAKVHITLAVDDMASLNPGATLIDPLPAAQSRSLGLGAGVTTEAVSTTDYEFFVSFSELDLRSCNYNGGLLLESDLHIDDLFDRALEPVKDGTLRVGQHPGFGGSSPPATPTNQIPDYNALHSVFEKIRAAEISEGPRFTPFGKELDEQHQIDDKKLAATQLETKAQAYINNIVKPVSDILVASYPACAKTVNQFRNSAIIQAALISNDKIEVDRSTTLDSAKTGFAAMTKGLTELENVVEQIIGSLKSCPKLPVPQPTPLVYDPLDLISETINFYITSSGSVTPTWKLVRVSAPVSSTFFSASRKDTNTLILALGRPDLTKNANSSTAVTNQILTSTLKDALQH